MTRTPRLCAPRARLCSLIIAVLCAVGLLSACTPAKPWTDPNTTVKIMPLGDSITQAEKGRATYRAPLYNALVGNGCNVDFVGSENATLGGNVSGLSYDTDHEGHWGWHANEIRDNVANWAGSAQPDVVLLHIGTNDVRYDDSPTNVRSEIVQIINHLRGANANIAIVLAQVIPTTDWANPRVVALNAQIATIPSQLGTENSPIVLVDQYGGFDLNSDTYDTVHPNLSGAEKMATRWMAGLRGLSGWPC